LSSNKDIARAFLIEAAADLRSARLLLSGKEYSQSIVHCQHAAEKTLKAALALRNIIITRQHAVSPDFVAAFPDLTEANQIALPLGAPQRGDLGVPGLRLPGGGAPRLRPRHGVAPHPQRAAAGCHGGAATRESRGGKARKGGF